MNVKAIFTRIALLSSMLMVSLGPVLAQPAERGPRHNPDPAKRVEMRLDLLQDRLELNEDQLETIRGILEEAQREGLAWREDHPEASREDRRAFRNDHRSATSAAILDALDEEQKEKFNDLKADGPRMGRGMHGGRHGKAMDGGGDRAFHRSHAGQTARGFGTALRGLNLSEEQREAIRNILTDEQKQKLDRMLARGHRNFGGPGGHGGPGMMLNRLDLTDEQKDRLKELRENHHAAAMAWHEANPDATGEERRTFREAHRAGMKAQVKAVLTDEQREQLESLMKDHPQQHHGPHRGR